MYGIGVEEEESGMRNIDVWCGGIEPCDSDVFLEIVITRRSSLSGQRRMGHPVLGEEGRWKKLRKGVRGRGSRSREGGDEDDCETGT